MFRKNEYMEFEYQPRQTTRKYVWHYGPFTLNLSPNAYEPHDDSLLLAAAAQKHAFGNVLDLGCGAGVVGLAASLNPRVEKIAFADISKKALALSEKNVQKNAVRNVIDFVCTDLFSSLPYPFDTIAFNPPYLPTSTEEKLEGEINTAFDGGPDGRRVMDLFLDSFSSHLSFHGILLFLSSSISAPDGESGNKITRQNLEKKGFHVKVVDWKRFFFEELVVFKAQKP